MYSKSVAGWCLFSLLATSLVINTFAYPQQYPRGIQAVLVNGSPTILEGAHTGALAGVMLRRS